MENIRWHNENVNFWESEEIEKNLSVQSLFKTTVEERINSVRWTEKKTKKKNYVMKETTWGE